jgi:hypothetical protein
MSIPTPNLDDRDFLRLMEEALRRVRASAPRWTDVGPGDPGRALLEAFAHLTEVMIYRLNRVPDKAYRTYLRLMGMRLWPPQAAQVTLRFTRADPGETGRSTLVARGTRVTVAEGGGAEPPVFVVAANTEIPAGEAEVEATAFHCELVDAELVGTSTGEPGQRVRVARPPMVTTPAGDDVVVAVEAAPGELNERMPAIEFEGAAYRIYREVPHFVDLDPGEAACAVDRGQGTVTFAPSVDLPSATAPAATERVQALALTPPAGRRIRVWYRTGGGPQGNVAPGTLTVLVDDLPGVQVANPARATGGRSAESVENALVRGPQEFHAHERAMTARDYELVATRSGAVSRARAFAQAAHWTYAAPGSVEVVLVPHVDLDEPARGRVEIADLDARATDEALAQVGAAVEARRPLGIASIAKWARFKQVRVTARVGVRPEEDEEAVRVRVLERLHRTVNPLPAGRRVRASEGRAWPGWPFGQALRVSDVYDILLAEPGVVWADRVRLHVDDVPAADVTAVAVDPHQASTWYAARGAALYRSLNDCVGWEPLWRFEGETVTAIEPHPREPGRAGLGQRPGHVAAVTRIDGEESSRVYVSRDLGETWEAVALFAFPVEDVCWVQRDEVPSLLLATQQGLYEQALSPDAVAVFSAVDPARAELGFYQVVAYTEPQGNVAVLLAAQEAAGVYRSRLEGRAGTFVHSGLDGRDVRTLALEYEGTATHLWAGVAAEGGTGQGCFRTRLEETDLAWDHLGDGWEGGSCWAISFAGRHALAASHNAGVQRMALRGEERQWWRPAVNSGLPLREMGRFHPVTALVSGTAREDGDVAVPMVMAAGPAGVYRSLGAGDEPLGEAYEHASRSEFDDAVTLPPTWLFVSGDHDVEVVKSR